MSYLPLTISLRRVLIYDTRDREFIKKTPTFYFYLSSSSHSPGPPPSSIIHTGTVFSHHKVYLFLSYSLLTFDVKCSKEDSLRLSDDRMTNLFCLYLHALNYKYFILFVFAIK